MNIEEEKFGGKIESEKETRIQDVEKQVDETADNLNMPIDEGIKETVVAFNIWNFPTSASCEGHTEEGIPAPWINVMALNKPEERYVNEEEVYRKTAEKYNISVEDVKRSINHDAWVEAVKELSKNDETEEYKNWYKKNKDLMEKAEDLLNEFYANREVESSVKLQIRKEAEGFRVHNGGEDYVPIVEHRKKLSKEEEKALATRIVKYRVEMNDFAKFLKDKFLEE